MEGALDRSQRVSWGKVKVWLCFGWVGEPIAVYHFVHMYLNDLVCIYIFIHIRVFWLEIYSEMFDTLCATNRTA